MPKNTAKKSIQPIQSRPPIVTIMGHIDHGKTSILDKIRSTSVTKKEAGGITQHITAYQAQGITFIDTPGHAAFTKMRSRGGQITDLVVLVVSAVDGVMAQTKECLSLIKEFDLPFIVALNKIDLDGASPDMVKGQLVEAGYTPEDYGGQLSVIPVSAKTGQGLDKLLEVIRLNAEIMELKSEPTLPLSAVVIESRLDKNRGPLAVVIIRQGTLSVGDNLFADDCPFKVKALVDDSGQAIKQALPSQPVEILGFEFVPAVGSSITPVNTPQTPVPVKAPTPSASDTPKLSIIAKADVQGTLEALLNSLSDDVTVISSGVGAVNDNDVFMAQTSKATIFAYNVATSSSVKKLADNCQVLIFNSKIIYEILENIEAQVLKMLEPTINETFVGEGTIIAEFKIDKTRIAGVSLTKGEMTPGGKVHLKRDGKIIKDTKIEGIRQGKNIVEKIKTGHDCGMTFKPYVDFKINDVIISYISEK